MSPVKDSDMSPLEIPASRQLIDGAWIPAAEPGPARPRPRDRPPHPGRRARRRGGRRRGGRGRPARVPRLGRDLGLRARRPARPLGGPHHRAGRGAGRLRGAGRRQAAVRRPDERLHRARHRPVLRGRRRQAHRRHAAHPRPRLPRLHDPRAVRGVRGHHPVERSDAAGGRQRRARARGWQPWCSSRPRSPRSVRWRWPSWPARPGSRPASSTWSPGWARGGRRAHRARGRRPHQLRRLHGHRPRGDAPAAENLVPVKLELGGKSPNVVFADADLDVAIPAIVGSITENVARTATRAPGCWSRSRSGPR